MGANNSRLHGSGGEVLPARVRRRIEEMRKGKSRKFDGTLDGGKFQSCEENEGGDSNKDSLNDIQQAKRVEKLSKVVPLPVSEPGKQHDELYNEGKGKDVGMKDEKVESAWLQQGNTQYGIDDDEEEDDEEEEDDDDDDDDVESGRNIGPSSPSFKIYCREFKNEEEEEFPESKDLGEENQAIVVLQKSPSDNSMENFVSASVRNTGKSNTIYKMESVSKRKGKKKFGSMMKNVLHAKHKRI